MTSLRHLHEAALAKNLEDRASLQNLRPYTFMANVLIAMNPLKRLEEPDKALFIGQPLDRCPPHPYNIAEVISALRPFSHDHIFGSGSSFTYLTIHSGAVLLY